MGASYKLSGMMLREFDGRKLLSMPKQDGEVTRILDIGAVVEEGCAVAGGCYMEYAVIILVYCSLTHTTAAASAKAKSK